MGKHTHTKDESFIIALYEAALKTGDVQTPVDKYAVGQMAGMHARGVDATCKLLVQANFIKKSGEADIYLTPHGEKLVLNLLDENP
jgi:hypothetical protein